MAPAPHIRALAILLLAFPAPGRSAAPLTLPRDERPAWLARDGIVMAGSWEPLLFRVRRDGSAGYTPTPEQRAAYRREHSPEMADRLAALGVNFAMIHCYKGFGPSAERESMADAVRFAALCRDRGIRVGVYVYSGAFGWELLFEEVPEAREWVVLDGEGRPKTYGSAAYRYYWNRNHPGARAFYKDIVRFAVDSIRTDLVHFDNYHVGPGTEADSRARFRGYLQARFSPQLLAARGIEDPAEVTPPVGGPAGSFLHRAWLDFSCRSLAESYAEMSRYARTLRKDVLIECNPGGVGDRIRPPVDHGRLLQGGEAFWDEGTPPGWSEGRLRSRIRTYKVARRMDNMAFAYATTPLELAESMAFNLDCLGCICWFEYGSIAERPGSDRPLSPSVDPYVRFFHRRRDLLRDAAVIADAAVLRSFPSQAFAETRSAGRIEQALIEDRIPFQIVYDHHLSDLGSYKVLILAGCPALSDEQISQIVRYRESGGTVCAIGPAGTHDDWLFPRPKPAFEGASDVTEERAGDAVRRLLGERLTLSVDGPEGLCAELTEQTGRRLVHLVNYRAGAPAENVKVRLLLPEGKRVTAVATASPGREKDLTLPFESEGKRVSFLLPRVDVYEIVAVSY